MVKMFVYSKYFIHSRYTDASLAWHQHQTVNQFPFLPLYSEFRFPIHPKVVAQVHCCAAAAPVKKETRSMI